ncbi:MAG: VirB3 family type IV secretion system protein [Acidaminococcaceae bacterium]|nr:VirB3 family type IV secretion system protein [Acidaminococcaceae bacterium]
MNNIEGFSIPIHRSLISPMYWMGVPRQLLLAEVGAAVFAFVFFKNYYVAILMIMLHMIFMVLGRKDPQFHQVFFRYCLHKPPIYYR